MESNTTTENIQFSKNMQIKELKTGDIISDIFVVKSKSSVEPYNQNLNYRFTLQLIDKSGTIDAKYWGSEDQIAVQQLLDSLKSGDVVHVAAKLQEYQGNLELNINQDSLTRLNPSQYDANFFIEESKKDPNQLYQAIQATINRIEHPQLQKLCNEFYADQTFKHQLLKSPATKSHHHSYIGGLLEHIHDMLHLAIYLTKIYPKLDKDLLLSATLLCNIGKVNHLKTTTSINITSEGYMLGDMLLSVRMLELKLSNTILEESTRLKLLNCLISQFGKLKNGSPRNPATPEALALSLIKNLDSQLSLMLRQIQQVKDQDTDTPFFYTKQFGNLYWR
jgi:3'-5' exoribonuclease